MYCVFDTETTGLPLHRLAPLDKQPQIIEFFGIILNDDGSINQVTMEPDDDHPEPWTADNVLHCLINPGKPLSADIIRITGITDDDLKGAPDFEHFAWLISAFMAQADVSVAHNHSFDKTLIDFEFKRLGEPFPWPSRSLCTVEKTHHFIGRRLKLFQLYEHLFEGEKFEGAHRAEADVRALARCVTELIRREVI